MSIYVTVDGGTTNTRVNLVSDGKLLASEKISIGAKDCKGGNEELKNAISHSIDKLCLHFNIKKEEITAVIASGMITSEYGLCNLPHIEAPSGIAELHRGMKRVDGLFPELSCYFIPGVKLTSDDALSADMMRGEETEIIGLSHSHGEGTLYILPGSHSKHVRLDKDGRIYDFKTLMTGEMISALAGGTILSGSVRLDLEGFDKQALLAGYDAALKLGLNGALFKTRIMKNLFSKTEAECYSFFLGAILSGELSGGFEDGITTAVIGGKASLREPTAYIISERTSVKPISPSDEECELATTLGAIRIFEFSE